MKNIQIIDGAENCAFDIFSISDGLFEVIFPDGTDVAFIEEVVSGLNGGVFDKLSVDMWSCPVNKKSVFGIHGTLFYEMLSKKGAYYPNRRESDLDFVGRQGSSK